ncbi:MAG: choice-of-anchor J domain-containing protein [bacterium]
MKKNAIRLILLITISLLMRSNLIGQVRVNVPHNKNRNLEEFALDSPLMKFLGELSLQSFEGTFLPAGWKKITNFGGEGWQQGAVGSQVPGFEQGATVDAPPGGGNFVALSTWATGDEDGMLETGQPTDQWLITPQILNVQDGDTLKFYLKYFSQFSDNLDVLISTVGDSIADFDTLVTTLSFTGPGNNAWTQHSFALTNFVEPGSNIFIAFREHVKNTKVEGDALFLDLVEVSSLVTEVAERPLQPDKFVLFQNYPNPFNPTTEITFSLAQSVVVTLKVYNLLGQEVAALIAGKRYKAGKHRIQFDAINLPNGIYYYRIEAGDFVDIKKMTLLK